MIWSGLFWAIECKTHQSSTALLAIATEINMASLSASPGGLIVSTPEIKLSDLHKWGITLKGALVHISVMF